MTIHHPLPETPEQLLPREAYISEEWLELERKHLFSNTWAYAGVVSDLPNNGDYKTINVGTFPLVVVRNKDGELGAFHNICRHRGTELLEGTGTVKNTIVCPYHRWSFGLDGTLRGVPNQKECFPNLDKNEMGLFPASIGIFKGVVFVHPNAEPELSFDDWLATLPDVTWPHDLSSSELVAGEEVVYEMKCNWKVFYENAIDGYHLAYLHENTLGPLFPDANVWEAHGQHLVWYSTERDGARNALPELVESFMKKARVKKSLPDGDTYGGVYTLFPTTILTPNPYGISISELVPVSAGVTLLKARNWTLKKAKGRFGNIKDAPGYDKDRGVITSDKWKDHPLETYDFQTEDVWVCEKMQRSLQSPMYEVGALAAGPGAESPIGHFQQCLMDYMPK
jgi:phenylpropionate dioxygenase-like ring-hydroxylating dioxygenase large terminal subunit